MFKKLFEVYKTQLLVSLTLAIVLVSVNVLKTPLTIAMAVTGAMLGTFILDLDYIIYAYFLEPEQSFSKSLRGYLEHKDFSGALNQIYYNRSEVKDKALNSAMFQIVLAGAAVFAASSTTGLFIKAVVISILANSIYKLADYYFDGKAKEWFWAFKNTPTKNGIMIYGAVIILVLAYSVSLF